MLEEQADFGDCRNLSMNSLGRPINLPLKRKGAVKSGSPTSLKGLKAGLRAAVDSRQLRVKMGRAAWVGLPPYGANGQASFEGGVPHA